MDETTAFAFWMTVLPKWVTGPTVAAIYCFQLLCAVDAPESLRISPETTLIVEPLAEDGLPDFAQAILDRQREGVTPENNGAIQFWQALGISEIAQEHREVFLSELGATAPESDGTLGAEWPTQLKDEVASWLKEKSTELATSDKATHHTLAERLIRECQARPWPALDVDPLNEWVRDNREPLELLVIASKKESFYSPAPNLLVEPPPLLISALLHDIARMREAYEALVMRAMYRLSNSHLQAAWQDISAISKLANHCRNRDEIVSQLVSSAGRTISYQATNSWLSLVEDADALRDAITGTHSQEEFQGMTHALKFGEPLLLIDSICHAMTSSEFWEDESEPLAIAIKRAGGADITKVLVTCHSWWSEYSNLANIKNRIERRREASMFLESLLEETNHISATQTPELLIASTEHRSKVLAYYMLCLFVPDLEKAFVAEDRCVAEQRMTLLALACRLHFLKQGSYPESLNELAPAVLDSIPIDPFSNKPFLYERRSDGFLIYSVGENGEDDGANDQSGDFIDGEHAPIDWLGEREEPEGVDDLVVRIPVPQLELPETLFTDE